ncbi:metalloproteinase [Verticillium alfalfae VaMs.102]|uniref:Neutral protease 2 n=1 Tax=Verticillium alfalfae (strain VaMs.102 / ATCC MYA-4576 / FGSC 10136) TaxID=526221 RepID=C9SYS6_VERA1|nr:metalloproteinase [Verticillium alfalfae VaMs.102]EEY23941.1 metalloproteinase [Verticillium alfalfae VaMs.102]
MHSRRFFALLGAALSACSVTAHSIARRAALSQGNVEVTLSSVESAPLLIEATIKNAGSKDLAFLKAGTIFGSTRVQLLDAQRIELDGSRQKAAFQGIVGSVDFEALAPENYEVPRPGSAIIKRIGAAALYGLSAGTYEFSASGLFAAQPDSASLPTVSEEYKSNTLTVTVAEATACCLASTSAPTLPNRASSSPTVLMPWPRECSTSDSGGVRVYCTEPFDWTECSTPLVGYTWPLNNWIIMCPMFFDTRPPVPQECHKQDHTTTMIHEMTHNPAVYEVATQDAAYSYPNITQLDPDMALYNADTYSLFANAIYLDCPVESLPKCYNATLPAP